MLKMLFNRITLTGIFALLAFLFVFGVLINPIEIFETISKAILVFVGTLIVCIVVSIVIPGIFKLYALGIVAFSGLLIFATCCV